MNSIITSKWIPIGLVFTTILSILIVKATGNTTDEEINTILAVVNFFVILVYLPFLLIYVIRKKHPSRQKFVLNIGTYAVLSIILGLLTKLYHLPGSGMQVVSGFFILSIIFLPAWYILKIHEKDRSWRLTYFFLTNCIASFVLYAWFVTMHYPFYEQSVYFFFISFLVFIPFMIYGFYQKFFSFRFQEDFIFIFLIAYILGMRHMAFMRDIRWLNNSSNQEQSFKTLDIQRKKCQFIYDAISSTASEDTLFINTAKTIGILRKESDSLQNYISSLKAIMVSKTANIPKQSADTLQFDEIPAIAKTNYDIPTTVLFSSDTNVYYNIYACRTKIEKYADTLLQICPENFKAQFKQYNPIQINDENQYEDGQRLTWEIMLFMNKPLSLAYTELTNIQADAKTAEAMVLNELFNKANENRKSDIARQLTNISLQYENEKKEKELGLLHKEQELSSAKLLAKDLEISNARTTLIFFIVASVVFIILVVFIVRSNIQRKKANQVLQQKNEEIESQKQIIEEKQHEILDSIKYAKRLQQAILPPAEYINAEIPDNFILYKPKDIVAGDFYWAETTGDYFLIAAADSTGHGVPGAMVSVVCSGALNRSVKEFGLTEPGKILDKTRELVIATFEKSQSEVKDGMDISLLCINRKNKTVTWSGANNPLWYLQDNELKEIKADKQPIGKSDHQQPFTTHTIPNAQNAVFYLFTDGLADQFGGPLGKKFKYKQFEELLASIQQSSMQEQSKVIEQRFQEWKGDLEQVDDVCVIGIKT